MPRNGTFTPGAAAVVATYLAAVVATVGLTGHRILPLFEGVGPPASYQWVNPPPAFAASNVKPRPATTDLSVNAPTPQFASTADGQCLINLPPNAVPPHGADGTVRATIAPIDPARLPPLGSGEAADGNACQVGLNYQPSGAPLARLSKAGNVVITAPHTPNAVFHSVDGRTWTRLPIQPFGDPTQVGVIFTVGGWYVAAMPARGSGAPVSPASHWGSGLVAAGVVAGAVLLGIVALTAAARRRRR